jgi:hypothetical protein
MIYLRIRLWNNWILTLLFTSTKFEFVLGGDIWSFTSFDICVRAKFNSEYVSYVENKKQHCNNSLVFYEYPRPSKHPVTPKAPMIARNRRSFTSHIPLHDWKAPWKFRLPGLSRMKWNDLTHLNFFWADEQFSRFLSRHHTMKIDRHDSYWGRLRSVQPSGGSTNYIFTFLISYHF